MRRLFRWIKSKFRGYENDDSYGEVGDIDEFVPVWGIINPHTFTSKGAYTKDKKYNEYGYGINMCPEVNLPWEFRDSGGVYGAAKRLRDEGCNASLEPHKNAYNGMVGGFEFLVLEGDTLSEKYARLMIDAFKLRFPDRKARYDNGILWRKPNERGGRNLVKAKKAGMKVAILSETFFIDRDEEWIEPEVMAQFWKDFFKL